jgi:hypothetical protein
VIGAVNSCVNTICVVQKSVRLMCFRHEVFCVVHPSNKCCFVGIWLQYNIAVKHTVISSV